MEAVINDKKKKKELISKPLFVQAIKANWLMFLLMTAGCAAIFFVINIVVCSRNIFTKLDMDRVSVYIVDENLSWLQILGLLEKMGFSLSRISVMSRIDLNTILSDLVYKIAGVLLPMIYVMVVSNSLIANQVSTGSMAYVLSTPTSRKTVIRTNFLFLVSSLLLMYIIITGAAVASEAIAGAIRLSRGGGANMNPIRTLLLCFASFAAMFALGGVCFGASAFFNKSNQSIAVGGGICVLSFLCAILGLFGNKAFVSTGVGVESMAIFNLASVLTLIDAESIGNFSKAIYGATDVAISFNWIWEIGILFGIGIVFSVIGSIRFLKKDLPL
ncbi:MAG: ABC transporter permease subunit [Bacilli bacterium]|nr:ABC transporter permease subunit [Bacilli bacterium]